MTMLQIQAMPKPCFFKEFRNNKKKTSLNFKHGSVKDGKL